MFSQGVGDYEPLRRDRRKRIVEMRTGEGRPSGEHLRAQIVRELDRLELLLEQIKAVEDARDALMAELAQRGMKIGPRALGAPSPVALLMSLRG